MILFLSLVSFAAACKPSTEAKINFATQSSVSPTPTTPVPVTTAVIPLKLTITAKYDNTEWEVPLTFDHGSTTCEASTSTPNATCNLSVEEARLYYSQMIFRYSWYSDSCKLMIFQPYYYQAGAAAVSDLAWGGVDPIDCSSPEENVLCYGGAAPTVVPNFPLKRAIIYLPDESVEASPLDDEVKVPSSWSRDYLSNRGVASDLAAANYGNAYTGANLGNNISAESPYNGRDNYVANSFVPYSLQCRDDWFDLQSYGIDLTITDIDTENIPTNTVENHFPTWKEQ